MLLAMVRLEYLGKRKGLLAVDRSIYSWNRRYFRTDKRDPREDMLSQAFAGVLDAIEGLPSWLVRALFSGPLGVGERWEAEVADIKTAIDSYSGPVDINTQIKATVGGRFVGFVDLGIAFGDEILVWIESKHGSKLPDRIGPGRLCQHFHGADSHGFDSGLA